MTQAAKDIMDTYGFGMASAPLMCGFAVSSYTKNAPPYARNYRISIANSS